MAAAVQTEEYEAAELYLAWGGDINDRLFAGNQDRWVVATRAGEVEVEPQDPPEVFLSLGGFRFRD